MTELTPERIRELADETQGFLGVFQELAASGKRPGCGGTASFLARVETMLRALASDCAELAACRAALRGLEDQKEPGRFCNHADFAPELCSRCAAAAQALAPPPEAAT